VGEIGFEGAKEYTLRITGFEVQLVPFLKAKGDSESVMRRPQSESQRAFMPSEFEQQLGWYALAAAAAGVGILASQPAQAEIVYTKAHRQIVPNSTIKLDLNHDGIADFSFKNTFSQTNFSSFGRLSAVPIGQKNQIRGHRVSNRAYASALFAGARVGPNGQFLPAAGMMAATSFLGGARPPGSDTCTGPWANVSNRYLGLKFVITGKVHFGWARLNVTCSARDSKVTALLTGYAYETVPNRPIVTGKTKGSEDTDDTSQQSRTFSGRYTLQPASLGRLAQGVAGSTGRGKQRKDNGL
jgi:hypothetical protein